MDNEFFDPTMKTSSGELSGSIDNPATLVEVTKDDESSFALNRSIIIIGCDAAADICVEGKSVASYHAEISHAEGTYRIRHVDGKAAVTVNGREVKDSILKHGDSVAIGNRAFTFQHASAVQAAE